MDTVSGGTPCNGANAQLHCVPKGHPAKATEDFHIIEAVQVDSLTGRHRRKDTAVWEREDTEWRDAALRWSLGAFLLSATATLTGVVVFGRVTALYRRRDVRLMVA